ncbi:MAG: hypothetical protein HYU66_16265 [Armatimonadetes bacterium]|nr:hypothetical protein [Armatimonadota bacterium]
MSKRLVGIMLLLGALALCAGCGKTPPPPEHNNPATGVGPKGVPGATTPGVPTTDEAATPPAGEAPAGGEAATPGDESKWKIESGDKAAKVKVDCYFPMEGHAWVQDLNKKIVAKFPGKVLVTHIDWFSEEGGKLHDAAGLPPCSAYVMDGKSVVQKSMPLGGWTEDDLMKAIGAAVDKAYPGEKKADEGGKAKP